GFGGPCGRPVGILPGTPITVAATGLVAAARSDTSTRESRPTVWRVRFMPWSSLVAQQVGSSDPRWGQDLCQASRCARMMAGVHPVEAAATEVRRGRRDDLGGAAGVVPNYLPLDVPHVKAGD